MKFIDKDLASIQESRILLEKAKTAALVLNGFPQSKLDEILLAVYEAVTPQFHQLSHLAVQETGYGNPEDEYRQLAQLMPALMQSIAPLKCVGVIAEDPEKKTKDIGIPLGIVAVVCSAVSPAAAAISAAMLCIKSGNAAVFVPDQKACQTVNTALALIRDAAEDKGLPTGALGCLKTVTASGSQETIYHEAVSMILNIGAKDLLRSCQSSGKPLLYGSPGPSPVFIERTAQIKQAAADIITSRSFNYGMMPGAEQYVVVDGLIANETKQAMTAAGAYYMSEEQETKLFTFLCPKGGEMDEEYIGKSARWLAYRAGFTVPEGTRVLMSEKHYIADRNPYSKSLPCPILAYYIETDWIRACDRCMRLLVEESKGHTLVIHSQDEEVISQFAMKKPVARMLVNTSAVQGAMGLSTKLFPGMILGGLTSREGISADTVSPLNLIYVRKIGYGIQPCTETAEAGMDKAMLTGLIERIIKELNIESEELE